MSKESDEIYAHVENKYRDAVNMQLICYENCSDTSIFCKLQMEECKSIKIDS